MDTHAAEPGVAQGLGHVALQGDRIAKGLADGQQRDQVAVTQGHRQALGVEHQVLHLAGGGGLAGVDSFEQGFLRVCQHRHPTAQRQHVLQGVAGLEFVNGGLVGGTCQGHTGSGGGDHDDVAGL